MLIKNLMHPKNIYKNPPNFKELAVEFPEFRKYVRQELSGKVSIDYQDPNAVKELTRTLLKKDFNLDVVINESRLIPRVPLCLNYILWIEDLLQCIETETPPLGVDIGTGCVSIYSLLAAKRGWKMLATEVDPENFQSALTNINRNKLENVISLKQVTNSNQLLIGVIDDQTKYDFCMCNPPFFHQNEKPQNRTSRRPQLETVASNVSTEISTEGGELSFISKIIKESTVLRDQIKIYTTLVGKKSDFVVLKKEVQNISPKSTAFTEFCQGKTMRWGLAWTFVDSNLRNITTNETNKLKKNKAKPPLRFIIPKTDDLNQVFIDAKKILNDLEIKFNEESSEVGCGVCFRAYKNTWSHQRRKKRLKAKSGEGNVEGSYIPDESFEETECPEAKKRRLEEDSEQLNESEKSLLVEGTICFKNENASVVLEMSWMSGNKECLHQIFQYFKNYYSQSESSSNK